jgi:hypothetical protein
MREKYIATGMKFPNAHMPLHNITPTVCAKIAIMPRAALRRPWSALTMTDPYMLRESARIAT